LIPTEQRCHVRSARNRLAILVIRYQDQNSPGIPVVFDSHPPLFPSIPRSRLRSLSLEHRFGSSGSTRRWVRMSFGGRGFRSYQGRTNRLGQYSGSGKPETVDERELTGRSTFLILFGLYVRLVPMLRSSLSLRV